MELVWTFIAGIVIYIGIRYLISFFKSSWDNDWLTEKKKVGDYDIMSFKEIFEEHKELEDIQTSFRYLYTKVKELEKRMR